MNSNRIELNGQIYEYKPLTKEEVQEILTRKKGALSIIRAFDLATSLAGTMVLIPVLGIIAILIKVDSEGPVFYKQERIGRYKKPFKILKFRTMVVDADKKGLAITTKSDSRITKIGRILRKTKLDELPQLFNVIKGEMSLVGSRPEVKRYVEKYSDEFETILLLRPGITDLASIEFRDEEELMENAIDAEQLYIDKIMKVKLGLNFKYISQISFYNYLKVILLTFRKIVR